MSDHATRIADALRPLAPDGKLFQEEIPLIDEIAELWAKRSAQGRKISPEALALIKHSEGLRLKAYRCPAGIPTIGFGSTGTSVRMGMEITEAEAERLLTVDVAKFERGVARLLDGAPATQGQFDAMVSLAFNIGLDAFGRSTLLRHHKAKAYLEAKAQFGRWIFAKGKKLPGLVIRRAAEAKMYGGEA